MTSYVESKKKDANEFSCRRETDLQTLKSFLFPKGTGSGEGWTGGWNGDVLKLGCDDGCTTIIKFIELLKKKKEEDRELRTYRETRRVCVRAWKKFTQRGSKKAAVCKPRREASEQTNLPAL